MRLAPHIYVYLVFRKGDDYVGLVGAFATARQAATVAAYLGADDHRVVPAPLAGFPWAWIVLAVGVLAGVALSGHL